MKKKLLAGVLVGTMTVAMLFGSLTALIILALPVSVWADTLALTPADSGTVGGADPGGGWGIHIPTLSFVFQVATPIDVTALGYYFYTGNPLGDGSGQDSTHSLTLARWNRRIGKLCVPVVPQPQFRL